MSNDAPAGPWGSDGGTLLEAPDAMAGDGDLRDVITGQGDGIGVDLTDHHFGGAVNERRTAVWVRDGVVRDDALPWHVGIGIDAEAAITDQSVQRFDVAVGPAEDSRVIGVDLRLR